MAPNVTRQFPSPFVLCRRHQTERLLDSVPAQKSQHPSARRRYFPAVAMKKLSVSLPDVVAARARRAAERAGVPLSTWLADRIEAAADLAEARAAVEEYEAQFGEPDPVALAETRVKLAEAGVGAPEPPDEAAARAAALARLLGRPDERRGDLASRSDRRA